MTKHSDSLPRPVILRALMVWAASSLSDAAIYVKDREPLVLGLLLTHRLTVLALKLFSEEDIRSAISRADTAMDLGKSEVADGSVEYELIKAHSQLLDYDLSGMSKRYIEFTHTPEDGEDKKAKRKLKLPRPAYQLLSYLLNVSIVEYDV